MEVSNDVQDQGTENRERIKRELWPDEDAWTGADDKGWFRAPRTLPLVLELLASKAISGKKDPTRVYIELLARMIDNGIVEMTNEGEHAYHAGYSGSRGIRSWRERMKVLEDNGFIKSQLIGGQYKCVLILHPTTVVQQLRHSTRLPDGWLEAYRLRQIETKEASHDERGARRIGKIVDIQDVKSAAEVAKKRTGAK